MKNKTLNQKRLRVLLAERGSTQLELAQGIDLPPTTLNGYIRGRHPVPDEVVVRIARFLGVTVPTLLEEECSDE